MILALLLAATSAFASPAGDFLSDLELFKARSLTVRSATEKENADRVTTLSRLLQLTPEISGGLGREQTKVQSEVTAGSANSVDNYWRLNGNWNLFHSFSDYHAWRAARGEEQAQKFEVRSQELKTELDGAKAIFNWLYLHDVAGAQDELLRLKEETIRIGRDRYRQGKIPLQEVAKMEVDLSQQRNVVRQSEIDIAEAAAAYKVFFVDSLHTESWPFPEGQALALPDGEATSFATRSLRERALSLGDSWASARDRHWPSLDLTVSYKAIPALQSGPSTNTWSGTLELSLPLWSRFEITSSAAQSYATYVAADTDAANAERAETLRRDFLQKKIALSKDNIHEARLNLEKADQLYRDMLRSFQLGRLSTNDLFLEQDRKVRALLSYSSSRQAYHESLVEACALWGLSARSCLR